MIDTSTPTERRAPRATCPECGLEFAPRGLAAHRRAHHAGGAAMTPKAALPSSAEERATPDIVRALEAFTSVVGSFTLAVARLDANLERLLAARPATPAEITDVDGLVHTLEGNLESVLREIARVQAEVDRKARALGGEPTSDEQRALEQTAHHDLGQLRRRQADILLRLTQLGRNDAAGDLLRV